MRKKISDLVDDFLTNIATNDIFKIKRIHKGNEEKSSLIARLQRVCVGGNR